MDSNKLSDLSTTMIAFTGFLIGITTIIYYLYQIKKEISISSVITGVNIYILINILFLYFIKEVIAKK